MLDKFMQKLTQELEIEGSLASDMPGIYEFPVDENISVHLTEIPRGFTMHCTFGDCPTKKEEEFYTELLHANLYCEGTEGSVLGLDAECKKLTLSRKIDYNIEYKEFRDLIEDFLNSVEFWMDEVKAVGMKIV